MLYMLMGLTQLFGNIKKIERNSFGMCCVTIKSRVTAHENLTQVIGQVENGHPQIYNHQKDCNKNHY